MAMTKKWLSPAEILRAGMSSPDTILRENLTPALYATHAYYSLEYSNIAYIETAISIVNANKTKSLGYVDENDSTLFLLTILILRKKLTTHTLLKTHMNKLLSLAHSIVEHSSDLTEFTKVNIFQINGIFWTLYTIYKISDQGIYNEILDVLKHLFYKLKANGYVYRDLGDDISWTSLSTGRDYTTKSIMPPSLSKILS